MKLRKFLSALCTATLLVTLVAVGFPVATVSAAATEYTQGFEPRLTKAYGSGISLSDEQAVSGKYSAKTVISKYGSSSENPRTAICDANGPVLFTVGTKYTVTMKVYADKTFDAKVRVTSDPTLFHTVHFDGRASESKETLQGGTWNDVTVTATPKHNADGTQVYLSVAVTTNNETITTNEGYPYTVYVDDVKVKEATAEEWLVEQDFEDAYAPSAKYGDVVSSTDYARTGTSSLKITIDNNKPTAKVTDRVVVEGADGKPVTYTADAQHGYTLSAWYYTEDTFVGKVRFLCETNLKDLSQTNPVFVGYDLTNAGGGTATLETGKWVQVTKTIDSLDALNGEVGYWSVGVAQYDTNGTQVSSATIYIDDVSIVENVAEPDVIETDLKGKTAAFFGDSIAAGWRDDGNGGAHKAGRGWSLRLEKLWGMTTTKAAQAGNSLTVIPDRGHIIDQLHAKKSASFDYVIMEGGFNDCMGENKPGNDNMDAIPKLGTISDTFNVEDFDTTTFAGSFEELLYYATTYWPEAKIGFIVTYQTPLSQYGGITNGVRQTNEGYTQEDYFIMQQLLCDKWNVPYLDLWSGMTADGKTYSGDILDVDADGVHFPGGNDNIHLNTAGYDVITPYIADWMLGLPAYEAPEGAFAKMNSITSVYQYVGGEGDKSSIQGDAGSAVYKHADGTLRTAFRVPATYVTDKADCSTIVLDGISYPIEERGIILGTVGQALTVDSPLKVKTTKNYDNYWKYDEATGTVTYTALVKNVTQDMLYTNYIARSYVVITVGGNQLVVYSDVSASFSPQSIYTAVKNQIEAAGGTAPAWFPAKDHIDDGVIELD